MNIALPALILHLVPHIRFAFELWFLPAAMWVVFLGACGFFIVVGRALSWSKQCVGAVILVAGLGNTSFVGFALIAAVRGPDALRLALIADQLGTFTMLMIGGAAVAAAYSGARVDAASIAKKIVLFPPFLSLLLGLGVVLAGGWPTTIEAVLETVGNTLIPIALFSVGLQLRFVIYRGHAAAIALALLWKLALAPAAVFALGALADIRGAVLDVGVLQAAMAPMVTAAILADQSDLEPELANIILGLGILLSFGTVPLIGMLLTHWS
jgi:predicted permease